MYLRIVKGSNASYLYLVEGYRENGKVKQRTIYSFGKLENLSEDQLSLLGTQILGFVKKNTVIDLENTEEISRKNWGILEIINKLWHQFQLPQFFSTQFSNRKSTYDIENAIKLMLADRFSFPCSKLKSFQKQNYYDQEFNIELQHIYKTLEELASLKPKLEKHLFLQCHEQGLAKVDIVFFDVTTFYFESTKRDELRTHGYSKDAKFNEVQVVLSLLITENGIPLGYDLFPGNTYEGHTFEASVKRMKESYNINKVIIVADRGLNIGENLLSLANQGFEFIVGTRFKNLKKSLQAQILDINDYVTMKESMVPISWKELAITLENENASFKYKVIEYVKNIKVGCNQYHIPSKLICTWSKKRAAKDKADRERLVIKAKNIAKNGDQSDKRGAKKYLLPFEKQGEKKVFILNENKIEKDAQWDGFYVIETSNADLSVDNILSAYRQLWKIEESFRLYKTHLETRPLFHWKPERVQGHFVMSYIAFLFERVIEVKLTKSGESIISPTEIRNALNMMEYSELRCGHQLHKLYSKINQLGLTILKSLEVNIPKKSISA